MLNIIQYNSAAGEGNSKAAPTDLRGMMPDATLVVTQDGTVVDFVEGRSRGLQFKRSQVVNAKLADLFPDEVAASYVYKVWQANSTGQTEELEYALPAANGERNFEARFLPADDGNVAVIVREVSLGKQREAELRMAAVQAAVTTALNQLAAGLAHHIRNPLTPIVLGAELAAINQDYASTLQYDAENGGRRIACVMDALADIANLQELPVVEDRVSGVKRLADLGDLLDQHLGCEGEN